MINMPNEIISIIISAITSGTVTLLLDKRKERREDKKVKQNENERIYEERPELQITEYKEYIECPGYELEECDINVFMTKIENVTIDDDMVIAHYDKEFFNKEDWCCVIYEFKNVGKTDIRCVRPICTYKKDTILCDVSSAQMILEHGVLNYSTMYDGKIRVGESFTMRVCYHKECIVSGMLSSILVMGIEDCNNRCWEQPLFAPNNKIYDTYPTTYEKYRDDLLPYVAIECFKKPWLW